MKSVDADLDENLDALKAAAWDGWHAILTAPARMWSRPPRPRSARRVEALDIRTKSQSAIRLATFDC